MMTSLAEQSLRMRWKDPRRFHSQMGEGALLALVDEQRENLAALSGFWRYDPCLAVEDTR